MKTFPKIILLTELMVELLRKSMKYLQEGISEKEKNIDGFLQPIHPRFFFISSIFRVAENIFFHLTYSVNVMAKTIQISYT